MEGSPAHRVEDHAGVLRRGFDDGVAVHGDLRLPFERFASRALALTLRRLERAAPSPARADVAEALSRAALADVYLAVACEDGVAGAWDRFVAAFAPSIAGMAIRRGASRTQAEEMSHELPGEMFTPPPGGGSRTRLGTFDGAGSLGGWLAAIVHRRLVDRRRMAVRDPAALDDADESAAAGGPSDDPVVRALGAETGREFARALEEAWRSVTPREALVVLLRHRDGLPQTEIARLLGIGEPRVSRMLSSASEKLRSVVVRRVGPGPGRDSGHEWAAIERAVADFMATLPRTSDPSTES